MDFAPRAYLDHAALRHNLRQVRLAAPGSRVWAVIKANAYGHGMERVARTLDADGFAVARIDEAERLRRCGVGRPILVMGGVSGAAALGRVVREGCDLAVSHPDQLALLEAAGRDSFLKVWVKVDTGMHRLGFRPEAVPGVIERLRACPAVREVAGLMTHLANADDLTDPLTRVQCARLREIPGAVSLPLNIGNSAGLLGFAEARTDWVRPGIMLYGVSPFLGETGADRDLRPVMTLRAPLIAVNRCHRGDAIGYSGTWVCPEDMPVGVVGIGYGDGYPRHARPGTPVLLGGRRVPLIGRVSMDMITLDLRLQPSAQVGEWVTLWGEGLPVEEIAGAAGTIAYELLCGVTARVAMEHLGREEVT